MILKFEMIRLNKNNEDDWLLYKYNRLTMHLRCDIMHPDDLKAIWICHECRMVFVFHSDIDDHKNLTGHTIIEKAQITVPSEETVA